MVNCSYCDKELDRLVFCNSSHKTQYHRGDKIPNPTEAFKALGLTDEKLLKKARKVVKEINRSNLTKKRGDLDSDNYI